MKLLSEIFNRFFGAHFIFLQCEVNGYNIFYLNVLNSELQPRKIGTLRYRVIGKLFARKG